VSVGQGTVFVALGFLLLATKAMLSAGISIPWVTPVLGMAVVVGIPTFLLYMADIGRVSSRSERLAISVVIDLGLLMAVGLAANTLLPHKQVPRPLSDRTVMLGVEALCVLLAALTYRRHPRVYRLSIPSVGARGRVLIGLSLTVIAMAVMGAIRLNNGGGGGLTLCMLLLALIELALLVAWQDGTHPGLVPLAIYCVSLALLLMTSLRGWYVTGHDIQTENLVFELTKQLSRWKVSTFPDAYNACLSITILPTMILRWTRVADPYVFKVLFQVLFALCPVLVYRLACRMAPARVALLATIGFISFVTFFQDMPMLNRQEIAFLFLASGLLALTNERLSPAGRRLWFGLFGIGLALSHYSTTYVAIIVLAVAWGLRVGMGPVRAVLRRLRPSFLRRIDPVTGPRGASALSLGVVVFLAAVSLGWSGSLTHTDQGLTATLAAAARSIRWDAIVGSRSSDTSYSLLGGGTKPPAQVLADYRSSILKATAADRAAGGYYDLGAVAGYPAGLAAPSLLPLTTLGRWLKRLGLDPLRINPDVRQGSAKALQILILLGLGAVLLARRKPIRAPAELYFIGVASLFAIVVQVLLPPLSVNYGVLRAFQQALMVLDVFLVAGCLALVPRRAPRARRLFAAAAILVFFASSTGIVTQVLGGYGPQLHLNNAGDYYNLYYTHPEEVAAIGWLNRTAAEARGRPLVQMDPTTRGRLQTLTALDTADDIYPLLLKRDAFVFLGYANVRTGTAPANTGADDVAYDYPIAALDANKDLLYSSGGARVYR
jgi:uncharacterized membrane protein